MLNVGWFCDLCNHLVHSYNNYENIPITHVDKIEQSIWEIPLDIEGCCRNVLVCDDCKRKILPDPKSPEATSRPAD